MNILEKKMQGTVLITGANRGIGFEFVKQYAEDGNVVYACCRHPEAAVELQKLAEQHSNIQIFPLDVTQPDSIKNLSQTLKDFQIDILINNAGIFGDKQTQQLGVVSSETMELVYLTNAVGPLKMAEAFVNNIAKSKLKLIASVSSSLSIISHTPDIHAYAYCASKAALNMIMKSLSINLESQHIRVLLLDPGWVKTDMGGVNALIDTKTSVEGLRKVIAKKIHDHEGLFFSYTGEERPW